MIRARLMTVAVAALPCAAVSGQCPGWLSDPGGGTNDPVFTVGMHNNELVIGGSFTEAGGSPAWKVARFRSGAWQALDGSVGSSSVIVRVLESWGGSLYAGTSGDGGARLRRWTGDAWVEFGGGLGSFSGGSVEALAEYGGELIVGGNFNAAGPHTVRGIAAWTGTQWRVLAGGTFYAGSNASPVHALKVFQGRLIAGGRFVTIAGVPANHVAAWDGEAWTPLGEGLPGRVMALEVHNGELYAAGSFRGDDIVPRGVARWDGEAWHRVGDGVRIVNGHVSSLRSYGGKLYAGGVFRDWFADADGEFYNIAAWDGQDWLPVGAGLASGFGNQVRDLFRFQDDLVVAGDFLEAGGIPSPRVARYRCMDGCPADWNQDGVVNSSDISAFITDWLASVNQGTLVADFNGDGVVNSADISAFITAWLDAVQNGC